jgi:hypothetical protein
VRIVARVLQLQIVVVEQQRWAAAEQVSTGEMKVPMDRELS